MNATFVMVWLGQLLSVVGSQLTGFAMGVWVYQRTGSVTQFALIAVFALVPSVLLSPIIGPLVDRWDRRTTMIAADAGSGIATLAMAVLAALGRLEVWHIYVAVGSSAVCAAFQVPAYKASVVLMVGKEQLGRANGMVQLAQAAGQLVGPAVGGLLMAAVGLQGVILVDSATFIVAVATLAAVRLPRVAARPEHGGRGRLRQEVREGWTYLTSRPGLVALLLFFTITFFLMEVVVVLITPMVLSFSSPQMLGILLSTGGAGMVVGSVALSVWGGPRRRIHAVLGGAALVGIAIVAGGLRQSVPLCALAAFVAFLLFPISQGSGQAILQAKVAPEVQGRVFALQQMFANSLLPVAYLAAGPLADDVFEPLMEADGPLAASLGPIIGVGPGRGIGLLFIVMGVLTTITSVAGYLHAGLREVESLPDSAPGDAASRSAVRAPARGPHRRRRVVERPQGRGGTSVAVTSRIAARLAGKEGR